MCGKATPSPPDQSQGLIAQSSCWISAEVPSPQPQHRRRASSAIYPESWSAQRLYLADVRLKNFAGEGCSCSAALHILLVETPVWISRRRIDPLRNPCYASSAAEVSVKATMNLHAMLDGDADSISELNDMTCFLAEWSQHSQVHMI